MHSNFAPPPQSACTQTYAPPPIPPPPGTLHTIMIPMEIYNVSYGRVPAALIQISDPNSNKCCSILVPISARILVFDSNYDSREGEF